MNRIALLILLLGSLLAGRLGISYPPTTQNPFSVVQKRQPSEQPTFFLVEAGEMETAEEEQEADPSDEGASPQCLPIAAPRLSTTCSGFRLSVPVGSLWVNVRNRVIQHRNIRV